MKSLLVIALLVITCSAHGQVIFALGYDQSFEDMSSGKRIYQNTSINTWFKKPIGRQFNLITGLMYKRPVVNVVNYVSASDFNQFFADTNPDKVLPATYYVNSTDKYKFSFITIPIGIEFKLIPYMRVRYSYHINQFISGNDAVKKYLELGEKSIKKISYNHDVALMFFFPDTNYQLIVGAAMQPDFISRDASYHYQFTPYIADDLKGVTSFYIGINLEGNIMKRRRGIL